MQTGSIVTDAGNLGVPAIVVHGGAGTFERASSEEAIDALLVALRAAVAAGWSVLEAGGTSFDAVVEAVASLEDSGRFNAGRGAVATTDGSYEYDAGVMDGGSARLGAVCASTHPRNPVRAARAVAESGGLPDGPILLAGAGADAFCRKVGLPATIDHDARVGPQTISGQGTVGAVAVDARGVVAAATSTGGRPGQVPGRVGDSPVPGAGVLALPSGVAVSGTGIGEAFLAAGFAHRVAWSRDTGISLHAAVEEALRAVGKLGGDGGGIAVDRAGAFAASFSTRAMARAWRGRELADERIFPPDSDRAG